MLRVGEGTQFQTLLKQSFVSNSLLCWVFFLLLLFGFEFFSPKLFEFQCKFIKHNKNAVFEGLGIASHQVKLSAVSRELLEPHEQTQRWLWQSRYGPGNSVGQSRATDTEPCLSLSKPCRVAWWWLQTMPQACCFEDSELFYFEPQLFS